MFMIPDKDLSHALIAANECDKHSGVKLITKETVSVANAKIILGGQLRGYIFSTHIFEIVPDRQKVCKKQYGKEHPFYHRS